MYSLLISEDYNEPIYLRIESIAQVLDLISLINLSQNSDISITLSYDKERIC